MTLIGQHAAVPTVPHDEKASATMSDKTLELYIKDGCPFCHKVLSFMDKNGIELPLHNISRSEEDLDRLVEVGGKRQVPCLFVDGAPMYESNDIIDYLANEFAADSAVADEMAPAGGACTIGGGCSF